MPEPQDLSVIQCPRCSSDQVSPWRDRLRCDECGFIFAEADARVVSHPLAVDDYWEDRD